MMRAHPQLMSSWGKLTQEITGVKPISFVPKNFSPRTGNQVSENIHVSLLSQSDTIFYPSTGASQSQNRVRATIGEPISLTCPLHIPHLTHLSWNRCSTEDQCRGDWDKHRIAHVIDMTKVYMDHPERYKLDTNGTLTIKEVLPEDDHMLFFCRGMVDFGKVENITVLEIIKGIYFLICFFFI